MHAQRIIQAFLAEQCSAIHEKRRRSFADLAEAAAQGLGVVRMAESLSPEVAFRHRLKRCDRFLSNKHLADELPLIYSAVARQLLRPGPQAIIIVDWSPLCEDGRWQLLRAASAAQGRAVTLYQEIHPTSELGSPEVQRQFILTLKALLPAGCRPIIVTDAGFCGPWFRMLDELGLPWVGRIRRRDKVFLENENAWCTQPDLRARAQSRPRDWGPARYTKSTPTPCRLIVHKRLSRQRHKTTRQGKTAQSRHSKKQSAGQREPWLLVTAPTLKHLNAHQIVAIYAKRMQIEQTFRDLKDTRTGLGWRQIHTRKLKRLEVLLLLAFLLTYALWLIGLAVRAAGWRHSYGSKTKAEHTLSILNLARKWHYQAQQPPPTQQQLLKAVQELVTIINSQVDQK